MRSRTSNFNSFCAPRLAGEWSIRRLRSVVALSALFSVTLPACRQAAFNEYYVESMASEIRALEDRIYEYDSAYQSLEMENEDLRAKHERLQRKLKELEEDDSLSLGSKPSRTEPREPKSRSQAKDSESFELVPPPKVKTDEPAPIVPRGPASPPTELKSDGTKSDAPSELPGILPMPNQTPAESVKPKTDASELLPPPANNGTSSTPNRTRKPTELKATELVEEYTVPPALIRSAQQPSTPNLLSSPAVDHLKSNSTPRPITLPGTSPGAIIQGRIKIPTSSDVVLASANESIHLANTESVDDRRVVGIDFHPTLCRGINLDNQPGDDGIYLVITPRNQAGQIVNEEGRLTIVAEEAIDGEATRVSAWEIAPEEMKEYLEPIGASQGYHLRLPWQEDAPNGRTIQVFVKCEFEDGRKPVNRKEIVLSKATNRPLTWTPRQ